MLLRGVRLQNYRAFVREVSVSLRPLTLVFGYNSAGKSALLRALPLIAESIQSKTGPLAFGPAARGSTSFKEIRTQWSDGDRMSFGLDWAHREGSLDVVITHLASTTREVMETYRLRDAARGELRFEINLADERASDITTYTLDGAPGRLRFDG